MINKVLMIVYGLLGAICDGLAITFNGQPVFAWAQRELVQRMHQRELIKERVKQSYIDNMLAMYGVNSMSELNEGIQYKISLGAVREARTVPRGVPIFDFSIVCNIMLQIGQFLQDVIDSFDVFIVQFFGKVITALVKAIKNGSSLPDILDILFDVLKSVILSKIPYGKCFVNIPMSLMQCICKIVGTTNRVDVYAVGCIFANSNCDVSSYTNGILAMEGCLGIQKVIDSVDSVLSEIQGVFEKVLGIQLDFGKLQDLLTTISNGISSLSNLISKKQILEDDFSSSASNIFYTKEQYDAEMLAIQHRMNTRHRQIFEINEFRRSMHNKSSPEYPPIAPVSNKTAYEIFMETNDLNNPIVQGVKNVHDYTLDHADVAPHAANVLEFFHNLVNTTLFLFNDPNLTMDKVHYHYGRVAFSSAFHSIGQMGIHSRTYRSDNYTGVLPIEEYHSIINETTYRVIDYTQFYGYGTAPKQSHIQQQFNESIESMKQRSIELNTLRSARLTEMRGLSVTISIVGVLSTLLLGGALMSVNCKNICGACLAQGLNCCSGCSTCAVVLIALIAFFGSGLIMNLTTNSSDNDDFVDPFIKAFQDSGFLNIYDTPPTQVDITNGIINVGDAIQTSLNRVVIQAIRINVKVAMFAVPILVLPDALPDDDIISYIEGLLFYNYFAPCVTNDDCPRNGRCRARDDPNSTTNLCEHDCTSTTPCTNPNGVCIVAPFFITGWCPVNSVPTFDFLIDFQCKSLGYLDDWLTYASTETFQKMGWSPAFFVTAAFWQFVWANMYSVILALRFVTRLVSVGVEIPATGLFTDFISGFPIVIPFASWIPTLTAIAYFILPTVQTVIHSIGWFCGLFGFPPFTYLSEWQRFPNYLDVPDYGSATTSEWACFIVHVPSDIIGGYIWTNFLLIGWVALANPFTIDILLFLLQVFWMVWSMCCCGWSWCVK
jgi:hypothetical protein